MVRAGTLGERILRSDAQDHFHLFQDRWLTSVKLVKKPCVGNRVRRQYDALQTPCECARPKRFSRHDGRKLLPGKKTVYSKCRVRRISSAAVFRTPH